MTTEIRGNITRTFFTCKAVAYVVNGVDSNGMPVLEQAESLPYITVNQNDRAQAKRAIKAVAPRAILDTLAVIVESEEVRAMALSDFYDNSTPCVRGANGRVSEDTEL